MNESQFPMITLAILNIMVPLLSRVVRSLMHHVIILSGVLGEVLCVSGGSSGDMGGVKHQ